MKRFRDGFWTLLFAAAAVGFALTAHRDAWLAWRWAFLALAGVGTLRRLDCRGGSDRNDPRQTARQSLSAGGSPRQSGWRFSPPWRIVGGLAEECFPASLHWFAVAAMAIGAAEELLWRRLDARRIDEIVRSPAAVLAAAGSHAAYKTALFVFPPDGIARQSPGSIAAPWPA